MNKDADLFIHNIHSRYQDRISAAAVFTRISQDAGRRCGLYYGIYESLLISGLREYITALNKKDAETLSQYALQQGIRVNDECYRQALNTEYKCREKTSRDPV